ncbi:MAG: glycine--tRNA ligase, partial [Candidatus Hecatellales archaeon]
RRGFFWPSFEIYGSEAGFLDYGPLGALLKRKLEQKWVDWFVRREGLMLIDTVVVAPEIVFQASGHTAHFTDPVTTCMACGRKWRADHLLEEQAGISGEGLTVEELGRLLTSHGVRCPECGGELDKPQAFNELFKTTIGPYSEHVGYCRPETAQGMFVNFKRLYELARGKLPFGVAQVGRCLRNEISPRQGPIRLREFTIMEFEFFFNPRDPHCPRLREVEGEKLRLLTEELIRKGVEEPLEVTVEEALAKGYIKAEWNAYFMARAKQFLNQLGVPDENQYFREKLPSERAHYSAQTYDQVVKLSRWGYVEVSGHAWRTDYDLRMHMAYSGEDLRVYIPHPQPRKVRRKRLKLDKAEIGKTFRGKAQLVSRLLELTPAEEVAEALAGGGVYRLRGNGETFEVTSSHVSVVEEEVEEKGEKLLPSVVEPSFGLDRILYVVLEYAYSEKEGRVVLRLPRDLAPIEAAVFPLMAKDGLPEKAREIHQALLSQGFNVEYDESGSIGRRYARMDEAGTPYTITVDYQTLQDGTVTLRDRDTWRQVRLEARKLPQILRSLLKGEISFEEAGLPVQP